MKNIEGIIVPILTPIYEDETPNYDQLEALTEYVIDGGINAIFANGTTGEFARFTYKERNRNLETIIETTDGRVPVLAGVSDCGLRLAKDHAKVAESLGADALVTTMPYYFPTISHTEQISYMEKLCEATKLPVLLYNIPAAVGLSVTADVLDAICDIDNLYGIKDTSGDTSYIDMLINNYSDKVKIYVGDERLNYYGLSHGASGVIPSLANPFPKVLAAAWGAAKEENWEECKKHCDLVNEMNILNSFSDSWMSPNIWRKVALHQMGIMDDYFTKPYNPVSKKDEDKIAEWISYYKSNY